MPARRRPGPQIAKSDRRRATLPGNRPSRPRQPAQCYPPIAGFDYRRRFAAIGHVLVDPQAYRRYFCTRRRLFDEEEQWSRNSSDHDSLSPWCPFQPTNPSTFYRLLLTIAVRVELADVSPQVLLLFLVLNAREDHFCARHFSRRIFDVVLERLFIPHDARTLVCIGIVEICRRAGLAAVETIEFRADLVLSARTDRVTGQADIEHCLSLLRILRHRWDGYSRDQNGRQDWRV